MAAVDNSSKGLISFPSKPRVFILTDITNEPDDAESFCRYLVYSNQFQTEGVVATTSTWLRNKVAPEGLHEIVDAYEKVVGNLNVHAHPDAQYPSPDSLRTVIRPGAPVYGMEAVGDDIALSEGGELLLDRLLASSDEPLWVLVWGGPNVLAQVLYKIRDRPDAAQLRSKLRVYTISDQDDTGAWIRQQWPDIFYICSVGGWNQYFSATWVAISSINIPDKGGPDCSTVTKEWVKENIQIGPLGAVYPDFEYIIEGDTPTFLYLIQNGLGVSEQPMYGSWGGRYVSVNVSKFGIPSRGHFADSADEVIGMDGRTYMSGHASIWRWRNAFQNDFAARMQWTIHSDFSKVNHNPVISINGNTGISPIYIEAEAGSTVSFDASGTYDPDGDEMSFKWFQYKEPTATQTYHFWEVSELKITVLDENEGGRKVDVEVPPPEKSCAIIRGHGTMPRGEYLHLILEVTDKGSPPLTSYRRVLIRPINSHWKEGE